MFDRPSRHSSLETGELVLAQNDLDHADPLPHPNAPGRGVQRLLVGRYVRVRSAATWSKYTASRSIAASSAARASRSFSAGVSGGSRMAGTIAQVGGRYGRPITSHSPVSFVIRSSRPHPGLSRPWWEWLASRGRSRAREKP